MTTTCTVSFGSVTFTGTEIKSARLVEEISPIAVELPINTLELTLYSAAGDFSIINPSGFYANLQYKQPLDVYEDFGAGNVYMGKFYLDEWESLSDNVAQFRASDAINLLNDRLSYGWYWGSNQNLTSVLAQIMLNVPIDYEIDASIASNVIRAEWLPIMSLRQAIQQVAFWGGAYVTCARSQKIQIKPLELASSLATYDHILSTDKKGFNSSLALRPLVTSVQITGHKFASQYYAEPWPELYNDTLDNGTYIITHNKLFFSGLYGGTATYTIDVATANYTQVTITAPGTFIIYMQQEAIDAQRVFNVDMAGLPVGTPSNIISITDVTLMSYTRAQNIAQRVFDYYEQRYLQKTRLYAQQVAPGDSVLIAAQSGWIGGIIERMETNLTGGFISNVEIVGVVASTCTNILTANLTVSTGTTQTYAGCLDMFDYNITLVDTANLEII